MKNLFTIIGAVLVLSSAAAEAAPVTWTLNSVAFGDGGSVSGSFVFDATTDAYLSWSIATTATTNPSVNGFESLNGATYTTNTVNSNYSGSSLNPNGFIFELGSAPTSGWLTLNFASPLTDAGGTIALKSASESQGFNNRSMATGPFLNGGTLGSVVGAVPEPQAYAMLIAGLSLMAFLGRRRKSNAQV